MKKREASIITRIVGSCYHPNAVALMSHLPDEEDLTLKREPDNKFDPSAVAVYHGSTMLGYVPAVDATTVARVMDEGYDHGCHVRSSAPAICVWWNLDKEIDKDPFALD